MNRWLVLALRLFLALPLVGSGLASLIAPETIAEAGLPDAVAFFEAMKATHVWGEIVAIKLVGAALLATGSFAPLALILITPITLNIFLFELLGEMNPPAIGLALLIAQALLVWHYRDSYRALFRPRRLLDSGRL